MNIFIEAFNVILYKPLFNILVLFYQYLPCHDFGIAIIFLTILIRLALYPLMFRSIKNQKVLNELQPKIREIQKKHKENPQQLTKEIITLYKREKINPFSGFLPLLIQLPIFIALYRVFWKGFQPEALSNLYSFIAAPESIHPYFLGFINLANPSIFLAILAGFFQFIQTKMMTPNLKTKQKEGDKMDQFSNTMQKQMLYFFPIFTIFILLKLPSAVGLYWIITSLFSIFQQYIVYNKKSLQESK